MRQGDLVEVVLRNADVDAGVTIHWHGIDVPNAEDGVAGVTQNAVAPGGSYIYRFRAEQARDVLVPHAPGLVEGGQARPLRRRRHRAARAAGPASTPHLAVAHTFDGSPDAERRRRAAAAAVAPGTPVRLRLVNTDSFERRFTIDGTPFRVLAIDGSDLHGPGELENVALPLAAGGRYDVGFVQPARRSASRSRARMRRSPSARTAAAGSTRPTARPTSDSTRSTYGTPAPTPFEPESDFDRRFSSRSRRKPGFFDGRPGLQWAINGGIYPDVPVFVVEDGDLVEVTITNDTNVGAPDAPARAPRCSSSAATAAVDGQPVVDGHAERRARRELRGRLPCGQPRDLDGPLPQPGPRRRPG